MNFNNFIKLNISKETSEILEKGIDKFNLNASDFYTIIDLINYSEVEDQSQKNILVYILLLIFSSLKEGSLCLKINSINIKNKLDLITESSDYSKKIIMDFIFNIKNFKNIITGDHLKYMPIIYQKKDNDILLYFEKYLSYEKKLKYEIDRFLQNNLDDDLKSIDQNIIDDLKKSKLNNKQKIAILLSLIKNFTIISGGPGTGKTYIIYFLIKSFLKKGISFERIKLAAPTGKSAERLTESIKKNINDNDEKKDDLIKLEGETIHRLLKYSNIKNDFIYNEKNKLPLEVIIIDEVSMVDIVLMSKLLASVPDKAKVIFLGDKDQLPSIEAGSVLAELIPHDCEEIFSDYIKIISNKYKTGNYKSKMQDRIIILEESYRSNDAIKNFSDNINLQKLELINKISKIEKEKIFINNENILFVESLYHNLLNHNLNDFRSLIETWSLNYYFNKLSNYEKNIHKIKNELINNENKNNYKNIFDDFFNNLVKSKILTVLKEGPFGSTKINLFIKELFRDKLGIYDGNYFSGLPIIVTQNDYSLKLFNGDSGMIIKDNSGILKVIFKKSNDYIILPLDILHSFEIAFSITIHKSQGSEYNDILIVLPDDENNPILTKEILYTGITRARDKVVIYGKEDILKKTISKRIVRDSGINLWE